MVITVELFFLSHYQQGCCCCLLSLWAQTKNKPPSLSHSIKVIYSNVFLGGIIINKSIVFVAHNNNNNEYIIKFD